MGVILPPTIGLKCLYTTCGLKFDQSFIALESLEGSTFLLEKVEDCETTEVIYKANEIACACKRWDWEGSTYITMD
jgi:hypothetical protein